MCELHRTHLLGLAHKETETSFIDNSEPRAAQSDDVYACDDCTCNRENFCDVCGGNVVCVEGYDEKACDIGVVYCRQKTT